MTKSELQEMKHIKQLLARLQAVQLSTFGEPNVSMSVENGGYRHAVTVWVHLANVGSVRTPGRTEEFTLAPWQDARQNENICNGCAALVNAHREHKN